MTSFAAFSVVEPRKAWPIAAVRGVFAVLFGLFALIWPGVTVLVLAILYGVYAIVDGIGGLMQAFRPGDTGHRVAYGVLGALGIVAGILVLVWPGHHGPAAGPAGRLVGDRHRHRRDRRRDPAAQADPRRGVPHRGRRDLA